MYQQLKLSLRNQIMNQNNTELPEKKDVREIKVINLEEVSDKFEVESF